MRASAALVVPCLLLAGCAGGPPDPRVATDDGWKAVPGLDHIEVRGSAPDCAGPCTFHAEVRNMGTSTYRLHDSCAGVWDDWSVEDGAGHTHWPEQELVRCDLCDPGEPFPPGASRASDFTWDGRDHRGDGMPHARDGTYVARLRADIDIGDGSACGGPYKPGEYVVTFRLR